MSMPYRLRPGSWQPARLRWIDHAVLMVVLIVIAFTRGIDYLIGSDVWGARDFMIAAAPEWVWGGVGFVAGAAILTAGVTTRRHLLVYIGHGWLAAAYGLNALALILASGPTYAFPLVVAATAVITCVGVLAHRLAKKSGTGACALIFATAATFAGLIHASGSFDGIRGGGSVGLVAFIHLAHMLRTGGRPLRVDQEAA